VGKTVVSAALLRRYRHAAPLRYWKPVQTGIEQDDDTREVMRLSGCRTAETLTDGVRLPRPVSPHLAARLSGVTIDIPTLLRTLTPLDPAIRWLVEGAGGVLTPLNARETMIDLMVQLSFPGVVVARTALGTINHTLLTLEALRARAIEVVGVVLVGPTNIETRKAIEHYGAVVVLGEMPPFEEVSAHALAAWSAELDPDTRLLQYLQ
jgi:dethiobiotin synthetase